MKVIVGYLQDYYKNDFNKKYFIALLLFVGVLVYFNFYVYSETQFISQDPNPTHRFIKYFGEYFLVFGGAYLLQIFFCPEDKNLKCSNTWKLILLATFLFALRAWFYQHAMIANLLFSPAFYNCSYMIGFNLTGFIFLFIPCFCYWLLMDKKYQPFYGMKIKGINFKPYFLLLFLMIPLLLWASQQADFKQTYPRAHYLNLPFNYAHKPLLYCIYEICYAADFFVTEFFFRGFVVLAFARKVGAKAILPMCAFYLSIHLDKPIAEAISSFFGGLLLGILAYRTKSVWGGVIVHTGIALLMELIGYMSYK